MNIGIDGNLLTISYHSGLRHYLESLLVALSKIDKKNKYFIFANSKVKIPAQNNFTLVIIPSKFPILKRQIFIPLSMRKYNLDVVHYPCDTWLPAFFWFPHSVVTLSDFGSKKAYPNLYESPKSFLIGKYYNFMRKTLVDKCTQILPISNTIKIEAVKNGISIKKMTIVYLGVDSKFRKINAIKNKQYFLSFADFSPRKNILTVLKAHSLFIKRINKNIPLVVITSDNRPHRIIHETSKSLGTFDLIKIKTNVSTDKLVNIYNKSFGLIYPSLYEGFGLPITEAMACGCPVITSNYGAMKEVSDNAAILVNPENAKEICDSMVRIIESKTARHKLIKQGLVRAHKFSWEKTAINTLKAYNDVSRIDT